MRLLLIAPLALVAAPLAAQDREAQRAAAEIERVAADPVVQDQVADVLSRAVEAVMRVPVGPLARAAEEIEPRSAPRDVRDDDTIGDVATRRDPRALDRIEEDLRDGTRRSARSVGAMARAMAAMMPALARMARDLDGALDGAADAYGREREDRRRDYNRDRGPERPLN